MNIISNIAISKKILLEVLVLIANMIVMMLLLFMMMSKFKHTKLYARFEVHSSMLLLLAKWKDSQNWTFTRMMIFEKE